MRREWDGWRHENESRSGRWVEGRMGEACDKGVGTDRGDDVVIAPHLVESLPRVKFLQQVILITGLTPYDSLVPLLSRATPQRFNKAR